MLIHHREWNRPSSTGNLIQRVVPAARRHLWRRERHLTAAEFQVLGRELWILHPHGEPPPPDAAARDVQVVLLDGSWREASAMAQEVGAWGRLVGLPMTGESRYWLRAQADETRFSTIEALMALLQTLDMPRAHEELRIQFELHVYANLRARGYKEVALEFLKNSPLPEAFPVLLEQLHLRRPRE